MKASRVVRFCTGGSVAALALTGFGCRLLDEGPTRFTIQVDSITAPDSLGPSQALTVHAWGFIGPDLCSRLDAVDASRNGSDLSITFRGTRHVPLGSNCALAIAMLDHRETFAAPFPNPLTIRVHRRDGTQITKTVIVR